MVKKMEKIINLFRKYQTFIKYVISAGISFIIDLTLFTLFNYLLKDAIAAFSIIAATILARIISSFINYLMNRNGVFKKNTKKIDSGTLIKYYILVIIQMCVSAFLVFAIYKITNLNETLIKIPVEIILFMINYFVQKHFIFCNKKEQKNEKI